MQNEFHLLASGFEETENFYKHLYEIKSEGEAAYNCYLQSLDKKEIISKHLYVPGLVEPAECFKEAFPIFSAVSDIALWKHSRYTPGYLHSHEYFEMLCVMSGEAKHYIEGTEEFVVRPGDIFILPIGTRHMIETFSDECIIINIMIKKSTFRYAFFDTLSGNDVLSNFFNEEVFGESCKPYLFFKTGEDEEIKQCIQKMYVEHVRRRKYHERVEKSLLQLLFSYILRRYEDYYVASAIDGKVKIFQYLKEHISDATLTSAAEFFNYNPAYLSRLIRLSTGKTFSELRTQYRMEMAVRLLTESKLKISEVAAVIGYENVEQFNRQFKKMIGKSPSQFRKMRRGAV